MLIRRVLPFVVAAILAPLLVLQVALVSACGTFLQPDYLADRLEQAEPYDFLLDTLLPAALDDARNAESLSMDGTPDGNPLVVLGVSDRHLVAWTARVAPRDWFDQTVRTSALEVWAYMTGRGDQFAITLRLPTDDAVLASETSALLKRSDLYDYAIDSRLAPAAEEALAAGVLPFGADLSAARVESAVRQVVSKAWFDARIPDAVAAFIPYATGSDDGFDVRVDLAELGPAATAEYKRLLFDTGAYDSLYDSIVEPAVQTLHGERIDLAPGVALHTDDVVTAIRDAGAGQWARGEVDRAVDEVAGYLFGDTDSFSFVVTLDPIAGEVTSRLEEVAHGRILALAAVTGGTAADAQARREVAGRSDAILAGIGEMVIEPLSSEVRFTNHDLRDALSREDNERLDDVRSMMRDGFLYTEKDLRDDIQSNLDDPEGVEQAIESIRALFSDGWTFTHLDLANEGGSLSGTAESLRYVLPWIDTATWIVSALVLAGLPAVWLLADGAPRVRAAWVAATVTVGALAACVSFAAINLATGASYAASRADAARDFDAAREFARSQSLVDVWVLDLRAGIVDGFTSAVAIRAGLLAAVALLALLAALLWPRLEPLLRRQASPHQE